MADALTPHELAAIAAFKGKVLHLDPRATGEVPYIYVHRKGDNECDALRRAQSPREWRSASYRIRDRGIAFKALKRREMAGK
jgi:hypothetical protein